MKKITLTLALVLAAINLRAENRPTALQRVHQAYLQNNSRALALAAIDAYKDPSLNQVESENLNRVLAKSFELNRSHIDIETKLPSGISELSIVSRRRQEKGKVAYVVEINGMASNAGFIKGLQLTKYPDQEILNKGKDKYEYAEGKGEFYLKNALAAPLTDGLYRLVLVTSNDEVLDVMLPLIDLTMEQSPHIISPQSDQTVLSRNPQISWQSVPPLKPQAYRTKFGIEAVLNNPPEYKWDVQWSLYGNDLSKNSVVVGRDTSGTGVTSLSSGRYIINVNQASSRNYGAIRVSTQSVENVVIYVK